ncbi:MAG TPA: cytochrome b N-terminal domain-containing protein [Mariprofundaceae bacterium]|nr:cytochrome b N-terminal domain-containing protein [Mariprofundaceae bacterium]
MLQKMMQTRLFGWVDERLGLGDIIRSQMTEYPVPKNLNYMWNFGSLALLVLTLQILTGIFLAMYYKPSAELTYGHYTVAFDSVERIMRDVNFGWLIRYMHAVGASAFFVVVYMHIGRGLYYGSYKGPRELLWIIGVVILLIMQGAAFFGYLLPWGQMSFWGATVITNLFGAVPVIGDFLSQLLRGGFSVGDPTLNRFFSLHYLFPLLLAAIVGGHIHALHTVHSNNPEGIDVHKESELINFHPYYTVKDAFGVGIFLLFYCYVIFFHPQMNGFFIEVDNYVPANNLQTPPHIAPVWYLTPWYTILRSFESKLLGVIAMGASLAILFVLPFLDRSKVRSARYRPVYRQMVILFFIDVITLGYCGHSAPTPALKLVGQIATAYYFLFFVSLLFVHKFEKTKPLPEGI